MSSARSGQGGGLGGLENLWVIHLEDPAKKNVLAPLFARSQGNVFLLAFSTQRKASEFITQEKIDGATTRLVLKINANEVYEAMVQQVARAILVDYDPKTQGYGQVRPVAEAPHANP